MKPWFDRCVIFSEREREREREREITHLELSHVSTDGTGVPEGRSGAEPRRNASLNNKGRMQVYISSMSVGLCVCPRWISKTAAPTNIKFGQLTRVMILTKMKY